MSDRAEILRAWRTLAADPQPLLARLADGETPAAISALRRDHPPAVVAAAAELARARARGLPERLALIGPGLLADAEGVEQASASEVARHKAARFPEGVPILDLCCGIGADAAALARRAPVVAVDSDPLRAWMCRRNVGCQTVCADAVGLALPPEALLHIDPSRRAGGQRRWRYEDYRPGPAALERLLTATAGACLKLGPGVAREALPELPGACLELISQRGQLVQAVLWSGALGGGAARRATRIDGEVTHTLEGPPDYAPLSGEAGELLFVPDPALERAQLLGTLAESLDLRGLHPRLALLTGDAPIDSPWLEGFRRLSPVEGLPRKRLARWLKQQPPGRVELRLRGVRCDAAALTRSLSRPGGARYVVFLQRLGKRELAWVTTPLP